MRIGTTELLVLLAVVIVLFGPTQIPKLTKMFGQSVKSFRDGLGGDKASEEHQKKGRLPDNGRQQKNAAGPKSVDRAQRQNPQTLPVRRTACEKGEQPFQQIPQKTVERKDPEPDHRIPPVRD